MVDDHYGLLNSLFDNNKELKDMLPDRLKTTVSVSGTYILFLRHMNEKIESSDVTDLAVSESLMFVLLATYGDNFDRLVKVCNLLKNRVETMEKDYNMKVGGV